MFGRGCWEDGWRRSGGGGAFPEDTPVEVIKARKPDVHVKGGDYKKEKMPETAVVEGYGGRVELVKLAEGKSSTGTIAKMRG